jgi:Tfp pilus assembly protein PilV
MRNIRNSLQRGLTLPEVGMALFTIGIGALCIATVYLQRERTVSITAQQATAQTLANELTTQITAQRNAEVRFENAVGVRCAKSLASATAQAAITNQVACWQERVAVQLPNGAGSIAFDTSTIPATYAVTVSWSLPRGGLVSYTTRAVAYTNPTTADSVPRTAARAAN